MSKLGFLGNSYFVLIKDSSFVAKTTLLGLDLAAYEGITTYLENDRGDWFAFFIKNQQYENPRPVILLDNKEEMLEKWIIINDKPVTTLSRIPAYFQYREKPVRLEWLAISSDDRGMQYRVVSGKMTKKEFFNMLKSGPVLYHGQQRIPGRTIFMDATHVKRRDIPVKFSLAYNVETGRLEEGTTSIKEIRRSAEIGDPFHFEKIRTHFSSEQGLQISFTIESEEVVARIRAERNNYIPYVEGAAKEKAIEEIMNTF